MSFRGPGLYEFLTEAELQQYYNHFKNDLKVQNVPQIKWVTDEDLVTMGLSKPEIRRLKKFFSKYCPQNYLSKMKRKLLGRRDDELPEPALVPDDSPSRQRHAIKMPKHIIPADAIVVNKELGTGEFGVVQQGVWTNEEGHRIQVAIKCLSKQRMQSNPTEFLKEATIMHNIEHEHIVRLYGVVLDTNALMLVTELAPLRSLLECLKEPNLRASFPVLTLCGFAIQICDGMQYLESKRLIHRDLAARNILVFSKNTIKISDFGLSRMLGVGKDYYQTNFNVNLKLPIAWCAPECINYLRFTSSSDVWAYGVTLWEMFSYGFQPWAALTGQQILEAIDEPNFQRLEQPDTCPKDCYNLMLKCWQHDPNKRPNFHELAQLLPECKPEQVQAVQSAGSEPTSPTKRDRLQYEVGDVVTVLDKRPVADHPNLWKGVTASGKTGLFNPSHFVAYLGSNLPSSTSSQASQPFSRGEAKAAYSSKRRLKPEMISAPQDDLKHTGHVGMDGTHFGDVSFLGDKQLPRQVVSPYKPQDDLRASLLTRAGSDVSDRAPLLAASSSDPAVRGAGPAEELTADGVWEPAGAAAAAAAERPAGRGDTYRRTAGAKGQHEYHEISDEEEGGAAAAAAAAAASATGAASPPPFQSDPLSGLPFDLGPSLMDEVMSILGGPATAAPQPRPRDRVMSEESTSGGEASNVRNELREQSARMLREHGQKKRKESKVRDISESDRRTLEQAIAMANDLAARSMAELDSDSLDSPHTPSSPTKKKFSFKLKPSPPMSRRNFSTEAASIPDIQTSLKHEEREAYNSLVQKPPTVGAAAAAAAPAASAAATTASTEDTAMETSDNPLRMLRAGITVRPKVRGNKHSGLPTGTATIERSQGVSRSRAATMAAKGGAEPGGGAPSDPASLQTWHRTMSIDRDLAVGSVPAADPSNPLPLPPRDRTKSLQESASKPRHQRKHPLLLPGAGGPAGRTTDSLSPEDVPDGGRLPRGAPPAKPPRLNLNDSFESQLAQEMEALDHIPEECVGSAGSGSGSGSGSVCPPGADLLYTWRDHVSCEDLLEFAADRPNARRTRGPAHGAQSDEVRIMLKVLGTGATSEACLLALNETSWDVHRAIKLCQVTRALGREVACDEVSRALRQVEWNVSRAVSSLMVRHGSASGQATVV
ncbi:activated Cdc42 kinase-like isoform X2 [Amphibalanus amphitrite]|uniref:activated Cdc42 kinase-like isoform X2 n=1 Tax=Amphibalanus amphitrite TaxID=1232801 RepID=UPI001C903347|nr:activated Cdc42 kinase-like isoform X2 [Amphibalanus amphitrite]